VNHRLEEFDRLVLQRLNELLAQWQDKLPVSFRCVGVHRPYADAPVMLLLEPDNEIQPVDCESVFSEVNKALVESFVSHECYFGLSIAVPHKYLNYQRYTQDQRERQADNERYRKIRLSRI
jgi:hypothetical protein